MVIALIVNGNGFPLSHETSDGKRADETIVEAASVGGGGARVAGAAGRRRLTSVTLRAPPISLLPPRAELPTLLL